MTPNLTVNGGQFATKSGLFTTSSIDQYGNITCNGSGSIAVFNGTSYNFYVYYPGNVSNAGNTTVGSNLSVQGTISNVGNATVGSNLSVQGTISNAGSILAGSDLTVQGNTTQVGSYGSWMKCTLYSSTYGTTQTDVLWNAPVFSYNIVKPSNTAQCQFYSAGVYVFDVQLHSNTNIISAKDVQIQSFYSTNNTTWTNYENSEAYLPYTNGVEEYCLRGLIQVAAYSYFKIQILNNSGANIVFNTESKRSYWHMYRVG